MLISGLQKLTLLDFPGRLATTVFLSGCNFRCPFCHNASLVVKKSDVLMDEEEFFDFLKSRVGKLEGVCVSGGEPTLYSELPSFIYRIKELGFLVKLDTNGARPDVLEALIKDKLIDYVAMDIKNSRESYGRTCGIEKMDISGVERSVELLLSGVIDYEFRTTAVKELHTKEDFAAIGQWIKGARRYYVQPFKDSGDIIEKGLTTPDKTEISDYISAVLPCVPNAQIRG